MILLVLMLSGQTAMARAPASPANPLVGSWHIAWMENRDAAGKTVRRTDRQGQLVYTPDGHMSVQVMYPRGEAEEAEGPVRYAQGGYEASWGRYDVDVTRHTVTHHVQGAMVHALVGRDLPRFYSFADGRLTLRSTSPDEHWAVTWIRDER
jgi:YD repeat-containing protein